ncbi:hypothetical protein J1N35_041883 [Gossypium stocksii]|uniref:Uncharacterized protein n=1 Tax=Gossypium stocksii TaxID=47602 RepID=A0A9D3UGF3_9ROSI|nr:hypothetical protein J1N35_041883 [Gossypium stocksii]
MTHIGRTTTLGVFATLSTSYCRRWELKAILDALVLLVRSTFNMARWVAVVHNISLEKALMNGMMEHVVVLV